MQPLQGPTHSIDDQRDYNTARLLYAAKPPHKKPQNWSEKIVSFLYNGVSLNLGSIP